MKLRMVLYCVLGAVPLAFLGMGAKAPVQFALGGLLLAASFVPVAMYGGKGVLKQFIQIGTALLFVTSFCTWTEAMVFMPSALGPNPWTALIGASVMYLVVGAILAVLGRVLKLNVEAEPKVSIRKLALVPLMVFASGVAYAIYYYIFGALTFNSYTAKFYPDALEIVGRIGIWFYPLQIGRGILMTLAVLPIIYSLRVSRFKMALIVGAIVYIAGGAMPMLISGNIMSVAQRVAHAIEIFTQNFVLGMTAVYLLTEGTRATTSAENKIASHATHAV